MIHWQGRLLSLFSIQPGEGRLVGSVLAYAILLYAANVLARTASYALFLTHFDADTLPYAYVGISVAAPLVSAVYLQLNQRFSLGNVLLAVHGFLLFTLVAYRLGLGATSVSWLFFSLPIYFGVNNSLTIASFWNLLGRIFNLQQGKRLFGLLSSGEHMATIVIGFLAPLLVSWLGTANLFLVAGFMMAATIAVLSRLIQQNADKVGAGKGMEMAHSPSKQPGNLFTNPYVRLIISLFALFIIGIYFVDNIFYSQAELQYPTEDGLAAFIGLFFGTMGVLSLLVQAFVAGRILNRFGVQAMILATPVGLLLLMGLFALLGSLGAGTAVLFGLIAAANLYRLILDAVDSAAVNVMYQPLPAQQRTQAQTSVIGIIYPLSIGATGLALLLFTNVLGFTPVMLAYLSLVVLGIWLATGLRLGQAYPQQVQQALAQRLFQGNAQLQLDEAGLALIRQSLSSPHVSVVLYALDTLAHNHPEAMVKVLPDLLAHPVPEVRQEALNRIEAMRLVEALTAVRRHIPGEKSPIVCAAALRTLATLDESTVADEIEPFLTHREWQVRQGALVGLLRNDGADIRSAATQRLVILTHSTQAADRVLAAQIICEAARRDLQPLLAPLLTDGSLVVRRAALTAAAKYPELWSTIVAALAVPETKATAAAALIEAGETAVPSLQTAFTQPEQDQEIQQQLARILGRIGTPQAVVFLSNCLHHPDQNVRRQIFAGLAQNSFQAIGEQRTAVTQQIHREVEQAAATMRMVLDLQKDQRQAELSLLLNSLHRQIRSHQENIFCLLSFIYEAPTIWRVWAILQPTAHASAEQRAYALESIEVIMTKEIKAHLLPFVSELTLSEQLTQLSNSFPQSSQPRVQRLQNFMNSPQPWLQLCALYSVGQLGLYHEAVVRDVLTVALGQRDDSLLWETAVWTLAQLRERVVNQIISTINEPAIVPLMYHIKLRRDDQGRSLITMAKVDILRRTNLFTETDEETLANIATQLTEVHYAAAEIIFAKGEAGDSMYIIVAGKVQVHDGDRTFNHLETGDVFGEMALLDPQPRAASVTAVVPSHLLRLDQEPFYELCQSHPNIFRGIIRVLSRYLRALVHELTAQQTTTSLSSNLVLAEPVDDRGDTAVTAQLSPIERLIFLKQIGMFSHLPQSILVELAMLLQEVILTPDQTVFEKGEPGDALYIIAQGCVRVHDADHTLNYLIEGQVFGEMALLDPEPRLATVTAVSSTHLLRLDQLPFYQLLEEHVEIATAIIHILSAHLRNRMEDVANL